MVNLKSYLLKVKRFLEQFKKVEQKKKPPKLKTLTKKQVNLAVVGGICFLLLIGLMGSIRAITLSNQVSSLKTSIENFEKEKSDAPSTTRQYDYRLQYYLNDFDTNLLKTSKTNSLKISNNLFTIYSNTSFNLSKTSSPTTSQKSSKKLNLETYIFQYFSFLGYSKSLF